ncbi:MAG: hydroxymethylglutaryl-CoA lyase [Bacteroidota bacterium]|nr:hydroxymethylglutaryl-CoA lyase [Bacteroidota bacterium]
MKIIECPRDAMQGIRDFIPTKKKISYINSLLKIGFDTIDFGSFVSPSIIPQLKDTDIVLGGLDLESSSSKLLTIIANKRGAITACSYANINCLGFPLSVSEEFQKRNTNKNINNALSLVEEIHNLSIQSNKELIVYISMAFGNPYSENFHPDMVAELVRKLNILDVKTIALADTIGVSNLSNIPPLFQTLFNEYPHIEFGAHFHSKANEWQAKFESAYENGCRRFDTTIMGYGGCPMAKDDLVGNIPTEKVCDLLLTKKIDLNINYKALKNVVNNMSIYF